jgi:hypothetical protein
VEEQDMRIVVSPRATQRGSLLMAAGIEFNDVLHMALLSQFPFDEKQRMHNELHTLFREESAVIDSAAPAEAEPAEDAPDDGKPSSWAAVWSRVLNIDSTDKAALMFNLEELPFETAKIRIAQSIVDTIFNPASNADLDEIGKSLARRIIRDGVSGLSETDTLLVNEFIRSERDLTSFWDFIALQ